MGFVSIICGGILLLEPTYWLAFTGSGIWGGAIFIASGPL